MNETKIYLKIIYTNIQMKFILKKKNFINKIIFKLKTKKKREKVFFFYDDKY